MSSTKPRALVLCLLSLFIMFSYFANAMDHGKFQNCDSKPFCKRLRNTPKLSNSHKVSSNSINVNEKEGIVTGSLIDSRTRRNPLNFEINSYNNGIFRLRIREDDPTNQNRHRYEVDGVIEDTVEKQPFTADTSKLKSGIFSLKPKGVVQSELQVNTENFGISFRVNGKEEIMWNPEGKFRYEREFYTPKPQEQKENTNQSEKNENQTQDEEEEEEESAVGVDFQFPRAEAIYGIPERTIDFNLKYTKGNNINSEPYRMFNLDIAEFELDNPIGLYGVVPIMFAHNSESTSALFWLSGSETFVDLYEEYGKKHSHWWSESGIIDVWFLPGPTIKDVQKQYAYMTGKPFMPQLFSIAYHQCRWNYRDEADVEYVDQQFDKYDIPYDVLWLDIEHTDSKKYFTWHPSDFPNPKQMLDNLDTKGRKMVVITDPHIKAEKGYPIYDGVIKNGYAIKNSDGKGNFEGDCWPGKSVWIDFFNPDAREFYSQQFLLENYKGSAKNLYFWIDMNEPSVFSGPELTLPKDTIHHGGIKHRDVHNLYGFYQQKATYEGLMKRSQELDRPFILSRSFFAGSQRMVAIWTGDVISNFKYLENSVSMMLTLSISGIPFVGADVGGFFNDPNEELITRWYQVGALSPFFRAHGHIETKRREPWEFSEQTRNHIREAVIMRYKLLPYWYTLFEETAREAISPMRPMVLEYPSDRRMFNEEHQFMIGSSILAKPVVSENTHQVDIVLPGDYGLWYHFTKGQLMGAKGATIKVPAPIDSIPMLQKGGSIIPLKERVRRCTYSMVHDPYTLQIALDEDEMAFGSLYIDDGKSYDYKKGAYLRFNFTFKNKILSPKLIQDDKPKNSVPFRVDNKIERIVFYGIKKSPSKVTLSPTTETNRDAEAVLSLNFDYDKQTNVLVVHNVNAKLMDSWNIKLE